MATRSLPLRKGVFWPPFLILSVSILFSLLDGPAFVQTINTLNQWMIDHFFYAFSWGALFFLVACVVICVSKLGKIRIGGEAAKPQLSLWRWFTITLCTHTAVGILFWATAEPIYHFSGPPVSLGISPRSVDAVHYAMATLFMHWSFIPAAIYTLPALTFAIVFYNRKLPFSLSSCLFPVLGKRSLGMLSPLVDSICLFTLISGMAASLATGVLSLMGGLSHQYGLASSTWLSIVIVSLLIGAFVASAVSGVQKGIRILSDINTKLFLGFLVFIVCFGPVGSFVEIGKSGLVEFGSHFLERSLFFGFESDDRWPKQWTIFYWSVWLAWAPVTALFLGRIGYGYRVRSFVLMNLFVPATFALIWMTIVGGATLSLESENALGLSAILKNSGPESVAYSVLSALPFSEWVIPLFLTIIFVAYVTAADSNTTAMAAMSTFGVSPQSPDPPNAIKVLWGFIMGALAIIMLCLSGIEGIKALCYLGGTPALLFELAVLVGMIRLWWDPKLAHFRKTS